MPMPQQPQVQAAFEGRLKTQKSSLHLPSKIKGVT